MRMVQEGYQPVYRPRTHQFGELIEKDGQLEQTVGIVDAGGGAWTALYTLEREPDGSWKITSCRLLKGAGQVA